jgi:hypothetical protein
VDLGHETGSKGPNEGALEDVEAEVWDTKELVRVRGVPGDVGEGVGGEEASSSLDEGGLEVGGSATVGFLYTGRNMKSSSADSRTYIPAADDDALVPGRLSRDGIEGGGDGGEELVSVIINLFITWSAFPLGHNNRGSRFKRMRKDEP